MSVQTSLLYSWILNSENSDQLIIVKSCYRNIILKIFRNVLKDIFSKIEQRSPRD
jgi:hypothetical protein